MGAIECLLESERLDRFGEGETCGLLSSQDAGSQKGTNFDTTQKERTSFTLIIHGGVMEEINLDQMFQGITEFSLQAALCLGAQELAKGGTSINAVQKCVTALEDCFLFGTGKDAMFNKKGKQEMEATIVDGTGMKFGSVALVQSIKNPLKAARQVMERNPHTLLAGDGALDILEGIREQDTSLGAEYFQTEIWEQLAKKDSVRLEGEGTDIYIYSLSRHFCPKRLTTDTM
uniref:Uncharacterized protein n=1 Tax=Scleropages formosus TaxID=113540 RepID=A0A8D0CLQ7_SCLFO